MAPDKLLWLGLAGAFGTICRALLVALVQRSIGAGFPWGTALVNLTGSLLFGLLWAATEQRYPASLSVRLVVLTGFMGAFTTFSTLMFDVTALLQTGRVVAALGNLAFQNLLGLAALVTGLALGRAL